MKVFGLIGHPLSHSFSKTFFTRFFEEKNLKDHAYELFDLPELNTFPDFIKKHQLSGLNVTIPYKQSIITYLDEADAVAASIHAVNCIRFQDGKLKGYNTDYPAFIQSLESFDIHIGTNALVFGTGGASAAVAKALHDEGINCLKVSRSEEKGHLTYGDLTEEVIKDHLLLINCTPVGMYPDVNHTLPIPFDGITENHIVYDLIYNPEETLFLKEAGKRGAKIKNGLEMLELQALKSWEIWNN